MGRGGVSSLEMAWLLRQHVYSMQLGRQWLGGRHEKVSFIWSQTRRAPSDPSQSRQDWWAVSAATHCISLPLPAPPCLPHSQLWHVIWMTWFLLGIYLIWTPSVGDSRSSPLYTRHLLHLVKTGITLYTVKEWHLVLLYDTCNRGHTSQHGNDMTQHTTQQFHNQVYN